MAHPREPAYRPPPNLERVQRNVGWLDEREHRYVTRLAVAAVPVFVLVHQPWIEDGRRSRLLLVAFGIGFSFALWITARMRQRGWAAFAAFLTGIFGPWGYAFVVGALYIGFAFWLLWRAGRGLKKEPPAPT